MFHDGARTVGGDLDPELSRKVFDLLSQFAALVEARCKELRLRRAVVRSRLQCSIAVVLDAQTLWIAAERSSGLPSTTTIDQRSRTFSAEDILTAARWDLGFNESFVLSFPAALLEQEAELRRPSLEAIAVAHVQAEEARVNTQLSLAPINPIFGPASYPVDPRLVFVLMPFNDELSAIYNTIIKPAVEADEFRLVCRRADEIKSNRAILQDIWKSLCEARIVIADLTGFNANVLYELGVAHTVGKETILIYQRASDIKFPFDLAHIRRIEYENNAVGGQALGSALRETIRFVLGTPVNA